MMKDAEVVSVDGTKIGIHKGVTCCDCFTVIFTIQSLIIHLEENVNHFWYKSGDDRAFLIKMLVPITDPVAARYYSEG